MLSVHNYKFLKSNLEHQSAEGFTGLRENRIEDICNTFPLTQLIGCSFKAKLHNFFLKRKMSGFSAFFGTENLSFSPFCLTELLTFCLTEVKEVL